MHRTTIAIAAMIAALVISPAAAAAAPAGAAPAADKVPVIQEQPPFPGAPRLGAAPGKPSPLLCSGHAVEHGDWVNADPATLSITKAQLRDCQAVTTCTGDICSITFDAGWATRLFGACSPTDCDWGWAPARFRLGTGQIPAYYDQGFAKRYVWAAMSAYRPGQLWIAIRTDFVDPNRADYESQNWFLRG